jgi:hypothetical protein
LFLKTFLKSLCFLPYHLKYHLDSWTDALCHLGAGVFLQNLSHFMMLFPHFPLSQSRQLASTLFFQPSVAAQSALHVRLLFFICLLITQNNSRECNKSNVDLVF